MPDSDGSSLWHISEFDTLRNTAAAAANAGLQRQTVMATTLQAELRGLDRRREGADALETVAACVRLREPALIYLQHEDRVWPVTLFPVEMVYHSPRSLLLGTRRGIASLKTIDVEPPGVRPPGHWMHERISNAESYHPLMPALWALALNGPRTELLQEVAGQAVYRALRKTAGQDLATPGALGPAVERLHKESVPLRKIAGWPGMTAERANRLVNALYLTSNLIVSRAHPSARPGMLQWLFGQRSH
jgi:hypothetical protein